MRPFSTHWTREPKCTTSVEISGMAVCCYLRRSLLPFYIPIQASRCAVFVWPTDSTPSGGQYLLLKKSSAGSASLHRKMRAAVLLKGRDGLCFSEAHPGIPPPTPQEVWRTPELEHWPWLTFAKIVFYRFFFFFFKNRHTLNGMRAKGEERSRDKFLGSLCDTAHTLSHT